MQRTNIVNPVLALLLGAGLASVGAEDLTWADITQIYRKVDVLPPGASGRPARVGERIEGRVAVATGRASRAELQFNDETLLRLGANTSFSLAAGRRTLDLDEGAVLIQTSPGGGGVRIRAGGVTAAITGSMGLFSVSPPADRRKKDEERLVKLISIHGAMSLEIDGVVYELEPFEMIFFRVDLEGNLLGPPSIVTLNANQLLRTSRLINGFENDERIIDPEILAELNQQQNEKSDNDWTVVTTDPEDKVPGLPEPNTVDVGSLIEPRLPPPPDPPEPPEPPSGYGDLPVQ